MSIKPLIRHHVAEGSLVPLRARRGDTERRALFMTEEVRSLLVTARTEQDWEDRSGALQADLEAFVTGARITPNYLFLLAPARDGVWEIRSVRPAPSIRVLGLFAGRDVFVATTYALREELGGWTSREWKQIKRRATARWRQLFPAYRPLVSTDVNDLVTGAIHGRYFKGQDPGSDPA